ncbi:MAG: VWA domain-containing protein [Acidobacteriota bacterium]
MYRLTLVPLLLTALLGGTGTAVAQDSDDLFGEVIDVRVMNLEVVVTEDGARVHGLGPEDFVLEVDGEQVPIEYFTEVVGGTATVRTGAGDATVPALAPGEPVGTSYLLFIDEFFSIARDRDQVLDGFIEQLPNLTPADRMAIIAYDGKNIEMLSNWSQSVPGITSILRRAKARPAYGLQRRAERRSFETRTEVESLGFVAGRGNITNNPLQRSLLIEEEQFARQVSSQVQNAVMAASSALRSFANPPGRKAMILLSGGWPGDPAMWVAGDPVRAVNYNGVDRGQRLLDPLAQTANRLGYSLYTVDVPGISDFDGEASFATVGEANIRRQERFEREREEESALIQLAERTGGKALLNSTNRDAFERTVADTRSYYWLGFTPTWKGDDSNHRVEVRVLRKGLKTRTRKDFTDLSRSSEVSMMVESALRFGDPPSAAPLKVQVGRGKRAGWGKRDVPLAVRIPLDSVAFLPTAEGFEAKVELRVAVLDEGGNTSDIPVIPLDLQAQREPVTDDYTVFETSLRMRNQQHDLVVSIYDRTSGKILSTKVQVASK